MAGSGLVFLILLGLLIWFWLDTLQVREVALHAARDICHHQQLQLLDATVTLQSLKLRRSVGRLKWQRTFQFSYSSRGDNRDTGFIITLGNHVEQAGL